MERNRKQKGMGSIDKGIAYMGIFIGILILVYAGIGAVSATVFTVQPGDSIQEAIDNLPAEGGIIELASGVHEVSDTIYINKSNVTIQGTHNSEIRSHNSSNDIFHVNDDWEGNPNLEYISFKGFKITSTYEDEGNDNNLIFANNVDNLIIEDIYDPSFVKRFANINCARDSQGRMYYTQSDGVKILNNTVQHSAMTSVMATNAEVAYNSMSGRMSGVNYGIFFEGGNTGVSIHHNYLDGTGVGANIQTESSDAHIYNNICKGCRIGIAPRYSTPNILIESNTITGATWAGIQFYSNKGLVNQTARNNIIYGCSGDGFQIAEIGWATATGTSDVALLNNVICNCGGDGIGRGDVIDSTWILDITNNIITNNIGYGIKLAHENITETRSYNDIWSNTQGNYNNSSAGIEDISADPLFADPANGDFHLKSTAGRWSESGWVYTDTEDSLCIDAGDSSSDYFNEHDYPLGHINMGAYGNTEEASKGAPTGPDTTSPTITTHLPIGTSVPVDTNISVTFNEAMDEPSAEAAFSVDGITGTFTWAGNIMAFTQSSNLAYETTYTATISTQAKDLAGNPLDSSYFCNFTTVSSGGCYTYKQVNPGESIQEAIDSLCSEGGTIELGAGIHEVYDTIVINRSNVTIQGTHNSEIRSHNSSADIFSIPHANPSAGEPWGTMPLLKNFLFKGFKVTSVYGYECNNNMLIRAWNVGNLTIEDIIDIAHEANFVAINPTGGGTTAWSKDIFIRNNTIYYSSPLFCWSENVHVINNTCVDSRQSYGINANRNNEYVYIHDNILNDSGTNGNIHIYGINYVEVYNNTCTGSQQGIVIDHSPNQLIVKNNTISGASISGILVKYYREMTDVTIKNNILYENVAGLKTINYVAPTSTAAIDLSNNVFFNNTCDGIQMTSEYVQLNIINNIITNNGGYGINYMDTIEPTIISYNDVWNNALGNYSSISADKGDISEDPLFVDAENGDFHIKSTAKGWPDSSPCIDAGVPYEEDAIFGDYVNEPKPNGCRINMGAYGNTIEASISANIAPIPGDDYIWLEAEDAATLTPDFVLANDASASNGEYIQIPVGVGFRASDGEATYTIHINSSGDYFIWGTTLASTGGNNSFFVQMDEGFEALWTISLSGNWQWNAVNHWGTGTEFNPEIDPVVFTLAAGEHTLRIKQREDGTKLDRLLITNNMSYVPAEIETTNAISGTVTNPCGTIIANATVTLTTRAGAEINTTQTDSTGHYAFANVSPDYYDITATKRSYWSNTNNVTVTTEAPETADIVLCKKGDLNTNSEPADAGDLAMMADATKAGTSDETYDLDGDGNPADAADLTLLKDVSVGVAELE